MVLGALTLEDFTSPEDADAVEAYLSTHLSAEGFPVTSWATGGAALSILKVESFTLADLIRLVGLIARGGLLDLAEKQWLTLLARSAYQLERDPPVSAIGTVTVAVASGFPPVSLAPGQLWMQSPGAKRYNAINGATVVIASGTSQVLSFRAESAGTGWNLATGTAMALVTPMPGVTVAPVDAGGGSWLTTQGTDGETDANLRARCRGRWATIGLEKVVDAYRSLAVNAPGVGTRATRVQVIDTSPRGPGTVDVYVAGPVGPLSGPDLALINSYMQPRKSPTANLLVANAIASPVNVSALLETDGTNPDAATQAIAAVTDLIDATPIGGRVRLNAIIEALMTPLGVTDVNVASPVATIVLGAHDVAVTGTLAIT